MQNQQVFAGAGLVIRQSVNDIKKRFLSGDQIPVQGPVLDGFGEVGGLHIVCAFEVGDCAGDFQDSCIGPRDREEVRSRDITDCKGDRGKIQRQ